MTRLSRYLISAAGGLLGVVVLAAAPAQADSIDIQSQSLDISGVTDLSSSGAVWLTHDFSAVSRPAPAASAAMSIGEAFAAPVSMQYVGRVLGDDTGAVWLNGLFAENDNDGACRCTVGVGLLANSFGVPEPGSFALFGAGLIAAGLLRRKRKTRA